MVFENVSADALGNIYIGLLGLAVLLYAILDGYDLGVGVLLPPRNEKFRDDMIASNEIDVPPLPSPSAAAGMRFGNRRRGLPGRGMALGSAPEHRKQRRVLAFCSECRVWCEVSFNYAFV